MNRWVALVMALVSIFMGTVFSSTLILNQPIDREEATELTYTYKDFTGHEKGKGGFTEIKLIFSDGSAQYIDASCVTDEIFKAIEETAPGTEFQYITILSFLPSAFINSGAAKYLTETPVVL